MNFRSIVVVLVAVAALALVLFSAKKRYSEMAAELPPREEFATIGAARNAAQVRAATLGGALVPIAGTGSMAPYIPAGATKTLADRRVEIVAYVATDPRASFASIAKGDLVIYRPDWAGRAGVIHQAEQLDAGGWIMSGLHNAQSEAFERMTADKFVGIVAYAAVLKTAAR